MLKQVLLLSLIPYMGMAQAQKYDLIIKTNGDSVACRIDSITDQHIYFEMKNKNVWIHTHTARNSVSDFQYTSIDANHFLFEKGTSYILGKKHIDTALTTPRAAIFAELGGKGYFSGNIDFRLNERHRLGLSLTQLDYEYHQNNIEYEGSHPSPGIMYYYLAGKGPSYFELGAGISSVLRFDVDYTPEDHFLSFHGVAGYRYQKAKGLIFRAGFTPFYRPNVWVLPLVGISLGYSF